MTKIQQLIQDCGLYLPYENPQVLERELEFLVEQVVKICQQANQRQAFELMGVIADVEQGPGFDDVCLTTIKKVKDYLHDNSLEQLFLEKNETLV